MERIFRVNGKEFTNEKDAADYEAVVKKEQEERAKAVAKAEAERKAKEETKEKAKKWVTDSVDLVNQAVERYEKETGEKLEFVTVNRKLTAQKEIKQNNPICRIYGFNPLGWIDHTMI